MKTYGMEISLGYLVASVAIFAFLKITGLIFWSWIWVFSPIWLPIAVVIAFLLALAIGISILHLTEFIYKIIFNRK